MRHSPKRLYHVTSYQLLLIVSPRKPGEIFACLQMTEMPCYLLCKTLMLKVWKPARKHRKKIEYNDTKTYPWISFCSFYLTEQIHQKTLERRAGKKESVWQNEGPTAPNTSFFCHCVQCTCFITYALPVHYIATPVQPSTCGNELHF